MFFVLVKIRGDVVAQEFVLLITLISVACMCQMSCIALHLGFRKLNERISRFLAFTALLKAVTEDKLSVLPSISQDTPRLI